MSQPGVVTIATLLTGVIGCVVVFRTIAVKHPPAVSASDPTHLFSILFAVLLTGYVWLALNPPQALTTSRFALRLGTDAGLMYGLVLAFGIRAIETFYTDDEGDPVLIILLMFTPMSLILLCSAIFAGKVGSPRAGIEASVWAGLIIALFIFNIWLLLFGGERLGMQWVRKERFLGRTAPARRCLSTQWLCKPRRAPAEY